MALEQASGNFMIVGINTTSPSFYWRGVKIPFIVRAHINWENDDQKIKLVVVNMETDLLNELVSAGITIKQIGG